MFYFSNFVSSLQIYYTSHIHANHLRGKIVRVTDVFLNIYFLLLTPKVEINVEMMFINQIIILFIGLWRNVTGTRRIYSIKSAQPQAEFAICRPQSETLSIYLRDS
jgi:hypothetical protein